MLALVLLLAVLIPGIGRSVNGAHAGSRMVAVNLQVSEPAKLFAFIYMAGYLVRRGDEVRGKPCRLYQADGGAGVMCGLLLLEPDFGASVVLLSTAMGMMFLAGVRLWQFGVLILHGASAFVFWRHLAVSHEAPDHVSQSLGRSLQQRFSVDPGIDRFRSRRVVGCRFGRQYSEVVLSAGGAHRFSVRGIAEEFGLVGVVLVIALYGILVWRTFSSPPPRRTRANICFNAFLAYGIGMWIGLQAFVNMGVNMGVLPTKGLTLPLMSFGGSSLVVMCVAVGLLLRIDYERGSVT